ncbi:MAG: ABC transporter permease [Myxococcota bacterium]
MGTLFVIALRNLAQHRRRSLLLGGAMALVTGLLVLLLGLSSGLQQTMLRAATTTSTGHVNVAGFYKVSAGQSAPVVTDFQKVKEVIRKSVPELEFVVERGRGWGKIISDIGFMQIGLSGIQVEDEKGIQRVLKLKDGNLEGLKEPNTALVFEEQAKRLELKVGDTVTASTTTARGVANTTDFRVVAIAESMGLISNFSIFVNASSLRTLYQLNDTTTGALMLYLKDISQASAVRERLRKSLEEAGYTLMDTDPRAFWFKFEGVNREDWTGQRLDLTTWDEEISFLMWTLSTLDGLTASLISILLIIIVVGIMNTMWIAIRERTREIGTLRAIGMQRSRVMIMFLMEALLLGIFGTSAGALAGIGVATGLNLMQLQVPDALRIFLMSDTLWLSLQAPSILRSMALIVLVGTLAALYPAWRAARLKPVTAMHHIG